MKHLTPDELIDAVEGTLERSRDAHLKTCAACSDEAARLLAILREAREVGVPEPSPLFWDHFSTRVRAAVATEETLQPAWWPEWLRWPVLVPLGGLALLVFAITTAVPRAPAIPSTQADAGREAIAIDDLATIGEQEWAVVSEMVGRVEIEDAREMGIAVNPGDAERIALQLNATEQRELVRLIKEEMDKAGD